MVDAVIVATARTLIGKLRFLEEAGGDPEIARRAAALRAKLG